MINNVTFLVGGKKHGWSNLEIKDRKGRWIDGSFVKEEDLA